MSREMKDSGVEWIGEIPEDGKLVGLGKCMLKEEKKLVIKISYLCQLQ